MPSPGGWYTCRVRRVGPADDGKIYVWLVDVNGSFDHWFFALDSIKREVLSVALTALSLGLTIEVALDSTDVYSQINRFYAMQV
jgi:hypothetical protein